MNVSLQDDHVVHEVEEISEAASSTYLIHLHDYIHTKSYRAGRKEKI